MVSKKSKKNKLLKYSIIILIILYIPSFLSWFLNKSPKLTIINRGEIIKNYMSDAMLLRQAYVIRNTRDSKYIYLYDNGTKVRKGSELIMLYSEEIDDLINKKEKLEKEIYETKKMLISNNNIYTNSIDHLLQKRNSLILNLYNKNINLNISKAIKLDLDEINRNIVNLKYEEISTDPEVLALENELKEIDKKINDESMSIKAPESGIFTANVDGYEYMEPSEFIQTLDIEKLSEILNGKNASSIYKDSIGKIVLDYDYYIILQIDEYIYDYLKEKSYTRITIENVDDEFNASIVKIQKEFENYILILSTDRYISENINKRIVEVNIILGSGRGIIIPFNSFYELDLKKMNGSIMIARNGYVEKVGVKVVDYNQEYAIIESDKIHIHDMLVSEPSKVKEGQGIN